MTMDVISLTVKVPEFDMQKLVGVLKDRGVLTGFRGFRDVVAEAPDSGLGQFAYRDEARRELSKALNALINQNPARRVKPKIILVVLPAKGPSLYAEVKRWGDCEVGIPTICVSDGKWYQMRIDSFVSNLS
jgi:hypothetical protein